MTAAFTRLINLAVPYLGAKVVYATDDFFADKARLITPEPAKWIADLYDDHGKWMDGWESRRKRGTGYDHAIVQLGQAGVIEGVDIDTSHFTGNYAPAASLDACVSDKANPGDKAKWVRILAPTKMAGNSSNILPIESRAAWTHLRLNIYPDGGVARLRVFGRIDKDWSKTKKSETVDLLAMENGGRLLAASDAHYGSPVNVTKPTEGENMGDAWETRRRREPGFDWAIFELGHAGIIKEIMLHTAFHKGNYPDSASIQAFHMPGADEETIAAQALYWPDLLPETKLGPDKKHWYKKELKALGPVTHVRVNMIPDGGISRLRLYGTLA
ncbi:MAG: allantoicase [Micavibrio sp.]|nr:allantoicase [Micavibrio sp.]